VNRIAALGAMACLVLTGCGTTAPATPAAVTSTTTATTKAKPAREFAPSETNQDPTKKIDGVVSAEYPKPKHVAAPQRVAYDHKPPFGGSHDQFWAACNGVVYPKAVRTENMVHALEHGAVWISYEPSKLDADEVTTLAERVDGTPYLLMSPYPGQDKPVSVQAWGRQLKVDSADDERIDQFITATKRNKYLSPEPGASCDAIGAPQFDQDAPPPFDPTPPGPDAAPVNPGVDEDQTPVP
jgi:hypothetical protein